MAPINPQQAIVSAGQVAVVNLAGVAGGVCRTDLTVKFERARSFVRFAQRAALEQAFAFGLEPLAATGSPVQVRNRFMLIVGHTDQTGGDNVNDPLSLRRARAVNAVFLDDLDAAANAWEAIYQAEHWNGPNFELAEMSSAVDLGGSSTSTDQYVGDPSARLDLFKRYLTALRPDWLAREPRAARPALVTTPTDAVLGCGSHHPIVDAPGTNLEGNRRVEFFFYPSATRSMNSCSSYPSRTVVCGQFISIEVELTNECGLPYTGPFDLIPPTGGVLRDQQTDARGRYTRDNVQPGQFTVEVSGWQESANVTASNNVFRGRLLRPISRTGRLLHRGAQPFRFFGTSAYYLLGLASSGRAADVDAFFRFMKDAGIYVVRTWGFNEDPLKGATTLQATSSPPNPQINPIGIAALETVVTTAARHQIYLIITLGDYNPHYGGICQYARWAVRTPVGFNTTAAQGFPDHLVEELFYTGTIALTSNPGTTYTFNFNPRDAYINYASHVINHFRASRHILAWELLNEPRVKAVGATGRLTQLEGHLRDWIGWAAQTIRANCPHLVSQASNQAAPFLSIGGPDIGLLPFLFDPAAPAVSNNIDLMDTHLYPENFGFSVASAQTNLRTAVGQAATHDKPFYLGEFGVSQTGVSNQPPPPGSSPPTAAQLARRSQRVAAEYDQWVNILLSGGASGMLFWQILPEHRLPPPPVSRPAYDEFEINFDVASAPRVGVQNVAPPAGSHYPQPVDGVAVADFINRQLRAGSAGGWSVC